MFKPLYIGFTLKLNVLGVLSKSFKRTCRNPIHRACEKGKRFTHPYERVMKG